MIKITFYAKPIDIAPKDRPIMLFCPRRGWRRGKWDAQSAYKPPRPYWFTFDAYPMSHDRDDQPTHWAEIDEMAAKASESSILTTPKPWRLVYKGQHESDGFVVMSSDGSIIATVGTTCHGIDKDNAHAICAVPEMQEALQKADEALVAISMLITKLPTSVFNIISAEVEQAMEALELVEAALDKAQGKT